MTGWHQGPLLAFDTETTGIDVHTDRIVQLGLARLNHPDGTAQHLWLLNPGVSIPAGAQAVHGITTERCQADGKPPAEVLAIAADTIEQHLAAGHPVVAFNAAYDCSLLEAELTRHGLRTITDRLGEFAPIIDPFVIDKHLSRRRGSRKLDAQCEHYKVRLDGAHDAGHDALAAARVAWRIAQTHPDIAASTPWGLHNAQVQWAAEQADSLRAYFDRTGKTHDGVDGTWPVRRAPARAVA